MPSSALVNFLHFGHSLGTSSASKDFRRLLYHCGRRKASTSATTAVPTVQCIRRANEQMLVVVGGGAAGVYAAIRAKSLAPFLDVVVVEKAKPLSKVKISGGGRCNVTNGHNADNIALSEHYPRGHKELRGSFFTNHGPLDTMHWFSCHGVELKTEEDGRVFPVSNTSSSIVDCLLLEAKRSGVLLQVGKVVTNASSGFNGKFNLKIEKQTLGFVENVESDYILIATGSSKQGYKIATQLGHSIVDPVPSLFTFKIEDKQLTDLSGVSFLKVKARLQLDAMKKNIPQFTQVGPMLVTHWGLSGPAILRLSAWGARALYQSNYTGTLYVDFIPDIHAEDLKRTLLEQRDKLGNHKVINSFPQHFSIVKRFWKYLLKREGIDEEILWASLSNSHINSLSLLLKQCPFKVAGKGQFKDEFVTAGGVPLSEISLDTMESKIHPHLYFAGEVLNVDGLTGGFNFQNAWSGGYIAGTSIGELASKSHLRAEGA